ncbi:MAG: RNA degradosome polyphosphate kinase [Caulobacterales bacterium]|nr:RNA degradosome polyphosphate kinase [Caulobacterales bacterium]MCA0373058.1 RNA degradosome polyphosphate kinase [Pseudomonadota bacterium]
MDCLNVIDAKLITKSEETKLTHSLSNKERYINRELSWLYFNSRVLEEAEHMSHPLMERLRFLSICGNNLDEFYMVRVSGLRELVKNRTKVVSQDGLSPTEQLAKINEYAGSLMANQQKIWRNIQKDLEKAGFKVLSFHEALEMDTSNLRARFMEEVYPLLTPLAVDPAHPFPFIPNLGFAVAFQLSRVEDGKQLNALVPIPPMIPRFMELKRDKNTRYFVPLETIIELFPETLFPGFEVTAAGAFRIIRDSDIELEEEAEDLILQAEAALRERRRGEVVRLKVDVNMPQFLREFIREEMDVAPNDVVVVNGILGVAQLSQLIPDDRPELKFKPFTPRFPERIKDFGGDCFAAIRAKDILVHHPFESFDVVVGFIRQAAKDPNVLAIKQTLYRTSDNSPIVAALIEAAEKGKQVTALVEIKARFDEEANLKWARDLERAGVHVVFGFVSLKTHAKVSLVIRREGKSLRTYAHFGTGNYHPITAKIYTDLSLFTADKALGSDAGKLFNYVTGYAVPNDMEKLFMSPISLKSSLLGMITNEIENAKKGLPAGIWAKLNALIDRDVIDKLYEASSAGVKIDLIVRGVCGLRAGVPGLSENISVKSIIGRFLEHSRIVCFANGKPLPSKEAKVFISSADWMTRNLERRVEAMVPIENPTVHRQILEEIMVTNFADEAQSWYMQQDGTYLKKAPKEEKNPFCAHDYFIANPSLSGRGRATKDSQTRSRQIIR